MSLILTAWTSWQHASISATRRNRERRIKAGDSSPPVDANYVMQSVQMASTLDDDFRKFAVMVGGRHAETYFVRCLQYAALHGAMKGEIAVPALQFGRHVLSTLWDEVCPHQGVIVHDALLHSGLGASADTPHTYADPFTCADHVTCRCHDHDTDECARGCAHPYLLTPSLSCSAGAGASPPAPAEAEQEQPVRKSHLGPVSPQPRDPDRGELSPFHQLNVWLMAGRHRSPTAVDELLAAPWRERGDAWLTKASRVLSKSEESLLQTVDDARAAIANGTAGRRDEPNAETGTLDSEEAA